MALVNQTILSRTGSDVTMIPKCGSDLLGELHALISGGDVCERGQHLVRPTVDDREVWQSTMQHIALEGRCFVLSACQYLPRSDCPAWYHPIQGDDPGTVLIGGGSVIVSPLGQILAGPARNGEQVLTAELEMDDIARGKFDLDVVGHYARPDIFQLTVEERPKPPVTCGD